MTWKNESYLYDLDSETQIEVTCRVCGLTRYETAEGLLKNSRLRFATLEKAETTLRCAGRFCRGPVRVAFVWDYLNEPFVGGMA